MDGPRTALTTTNIERENRTTIMEYREQHVRVAQEFAEKALDVRDPEARTTSLAYAQVHAQLATAQAIRDLTEAIRSGVTVHDGGLS